MATTPHGIAFPTTSEGERSTTATGRGIVADALRPVDPVGARAAEHETAWRSRYLVHFRRLVEAGLASPDAWCRIAAAGLESTHERMVVVGPDGPDGGDAPVTSLLTAPAGVHLDTVEVTGTAEPERRLTVPYRGRRLSGADLADRLAAWVADGVIEPSAAEAVSEVAAHPEWLPLPGRTVAVLGAGAEMGPLTALLRWGATVAAVDLPRPALWERVLATAEQGAGRLLVPVRGDGGPVQGPVAGPVAGRAGADLLAEVPEVADWVAGLDGRLVVGNYLYADGATHVRVSVAADVLGQRVVRQRPDTALAFLATPTDVFVVPRDAVEQANHAYAGRTSTAKVVGRPLRWASRGRLLHRAYPPGVDPGIADSLVPVQGPNYALAKRLQRWRATTARHDGTTVSFHVAPSTRTRSVVKNRALAAAFAGAHRFGVEVFDPGTSNVLMAALLVHDLMAGTPEHDHPWQDEAYAGVHGGLWRAAYEPRSALGLSALLGYAASRG
jgi:hypothetical protein